MQLDLELKAAEGAQQETRSEQELISFVEKLVSLESGVDEAMSSTAARYYSNLEGCFSSCQAQYVSPVVSYVSLACCFSISFSVVSHNSSTRGSSLSAQLFRALNQCSVYCLLSVTVTSRIAIST